MYFTRSAVLFALAASVIASPVELKKRGVLTAQSYAQFQVSDGTAGNALAEVMQKFPVDISDPAAVDPADAQIISDARQTAEDAETDAFNPAIDAASGADATALQNGKIKNKVLKLQLEVMDLMISGGDAAKIQEEQTKLNTNIALDKKAAGQASQSVTFTGTK